MARRCAHCGNEVETEASAWHEVVGWERPRQVGGTNYIAGRERTGRLVHNACMNLRKSGIKREQTQMDV